MRRHRKEDLVNYLITDYQFNVIIMDLCVKRKQTMSSHLLLFWLFR